MENLKKSRSPLRGLFTKAVNDLQNLFNSENVSKKNFNISLANVERRAEQLREHDKQIYDLMMANNETTEEDFNQEFEGCCMYEDKLNFCRCTVEDILSCLTEKNESESGNTIIGNGKSRKYKLPKIEFAKFGGDIKEWLSFWAQFEKIHEDTDLADEDKFNYLRQSTIENSKAREVIDSFPMTAANYPKVINHLQNRFGNKNTLVEMYVRELLKLVLSNALNPTKRVIISTLYDKVETQLRALESLEVTRDKFAAILYPLVESCLPEELLRAWQRHRIVPNPNAIDGNQNDRLTNIMLFLRGEVENEERISLARSGFAEQTKKNYKKEENSYDVPTAAGLFVKSSKSKSKCTFCDSKSHYGSQCPKGNKMAMAEKRRMIEDHKACYTCLGIGHQSKVCSMKNTLKCTICGGSHWKLMCNNNQSTKEGDNSTSESVTKNLLAKSVCSEEVVLSTFMIRIRNGDKTIVIRAAVDSGSHKTYMLKSLITKLNLIKNGEERLCHELFGGHQTSEKIHRRYNIFAENLDGSVGHSFDVLEQDRICHSVPKLKKGPWIYELQKKGIVLSDIGVNSSEVELLIGSNVAGKLLIDMYKFEEDGPGNGLVALNYSLGWALMGQINHYVQNDTALLVHTLFVQELDVSNLWRLDIIGIEDAAETKKKEKSIETINQHFKKTLVVNEEGRYEIALPFINGSPPIQSNRLLAEKRLVSMTKKLTPELRIVYQKIFNEWENDGIIEKIPQNELDNPGHYLPHKAVLKPNSLTTPVRPVFDASARERKSMSLNDCLEKGPNLLKIITSIISRFRLRKFGVISDIKKAFLQISIRPEDRDNLRFLWWESGSEDKMQVYRHKRVVFGLTCSSFLLAATINHILDQAPIEYQNTINQLRNANYVDNCVTSLDTEQAVINFKKESIKIMSDGKFDLRGWEWNSQSNTQDKEISVLGMVWNLKEDTLSCDIIKGDTFGNNQITKRKVLAIAHQIFDPIGFTIPLLICPKLYLQKCWELKIDWDETLPEEISMKFIKWYRDLSKIKRLKIPRWLGYSNSNAKSTSLHVFSDASKLAYAACVFLRIESENGVSVSLIQAKSRIAPIKKLSIPRLELLGCLMGTRLSITVQKDMGLEDVQCNYWTDSTNALYWITKEDQWGTYVWNRVTEIRKLTDINSWKHVPGKLNPADLPSRGCTASQLIDSSWWEGPNWLKLTESEWPSEKFMIDEKVLDSERLKTVICAWQIGRVKTNTARIVKYTNDYQKMIRFVALMMRIFKNIKKSKETRIIGELSLLKLDLAEKRILVMVQNEGFIENKNVLEQMDLFVDENQILRVKTKILLREDEQSFKTPAVLPGKHPIVKALINYNHRKYTHAGTQNLRAILREKYWIIRSRVAVKNVVKECFKCKRFSAKPFGNKPTYLPLNRVKDAAVFEVTGVDLVGHLFLRGGVKAWIVLFTCAIYRAIHMELVTSISTETFIQALRRFISRKIRPKVIYSDPGSNFVGSDNALKALDWDKIRTVSAIEQIQWILNPPKAPWWGGWWERLIGMVKDLLRKELGKTCLDYEEMLTVVCDCESVINGRPLTYVSDDPSELTPLTPDMFLKEIVQSGVADLNAVDSKYLNRKRRDRLQLMNHLRERFRIEYLSQLPLRKGDKETRPIELGEIVLIADENKKRINWPLARVIEIYPGKENKIRVAKVRTAKSELVRPVKKLIPLEIRRHEDFSITIEPSSESNYLSMSEVNETSTSGSKMNELLMSNEIPQLENQSTSKSVHTRSGRLVIPVERFGQI